VSKHFKLTAKDGHEFKVFCAEPEGEPRGGLVVVQEIFGVNGHIRSVAEGFARDGMLCLAPAYFDRVEREVELGYDPEGIAKGRDLKQQVGYEGPLLDTAAALGWLAERVEASGIVGYCWGGDIAWLGGVKLPVAAAVGYYGGGIAKLLDKPPAVPTMLHFGRQDHAIPPQDVEAIAEAAPNVQIFLYDAGHGFNCDQRASYDAESAELARGRSLEFLRKHLAGA
jgi:carboxymethylenebutenolidase